MKVQSARRIACGQSGKFVSGPCVGVAGWKKVLPTRELFFSFPHSSRLRHEARYAFTTSMMREKDLKRARDGSHGGRYSEAPAKRRRHLSEGHLQLSKLYEDLAAEQDEVRLEAAKQIVTKFSPQSHPNAKEVEQALDRLIRGLCTQRKSARFGFCVALTELLRQIFGQSQSSIEGLNLDVYALILTIENKTKVQGNVAGVVSNFTVSGRLKLTRYTGTKRSSHWKTLRI